MDNSKKDSDYHQTNFTKYPKGDENIEIPEINAQSPSHLNSSGPPPATAPEAENLLPQQPFIADDRDSYQKFLQKYKWLLLTLFTMILELQPPPH